MPDNEDPASELAKKQRQSAFDALTSFVSQFSPATRNEADTFYSTVEIKKAIADHTGFTLETAEIFDLMVEMKYSYEPMNGLEFNWMMRK